MNERAFGSRADPDVVAAGDETIVVAPADDVDLAALAAIDRAAGNGVRRDRLAAAPRNGQGLVARRGGRLGGFFIRDRPLVGQRLIWLLVVHPARRRRGVATALIEAVIQRHPGETILTATNASNRPMRRLRNQLGFARGWIDQLGEGNPALIVCRRLLAPARPGEPATSRAETASPASW